MQSQWLYQCFGGTFFTGVHANSDAFFIHKFQDGGPIPEVVIILRLKTTSRWSQRLRLFYRARRQYPISENSIRYKQEVETVPQTGSSHARLFSEVGCRRFERNRAWNPQKHCISLWDCVDICFRFWVISTSGLYMMVFTEVVQCRYWWKRIVRVRKHCRSRWDHVDIVFHHKIITTSGICPPSWT